LSDLSKDITDFGGRYFSITKAAGKIMKIEISNPLWSIIDVSYFLYLHPDFGIPESL
jgi:hypothetical protein